MLREKAEIIRLREAGSLLILNEEEMELFIPHRRRALKIDNIVFHPAAKKNITGFKSIDVNDSDLDGHFDTRPIYPGVSIAECANLTAALLITITNDNLVGYPTVVDFYCKCRRPVFPGDLIEVRVELLNKEQLKGQDFYNFNYTVNKHCAGKAKLVAEGKITGTAT